MSSVKSLEVEIALLLYAQGRLSVGKAHELAGMSLWEFRQLLGSRRVPAHLDEAALGEEVAALQGLGLL